MKTHNLFSKGSTRKGLTRRGLARGVMALLFMAVSALGVMAQNSLPAPGSGAAFVRIWVVRWDPTASVGTQVRCIPATGVVHGIPIGTIVLR